YPIRATEPFNREEVRKEFKLPPTVSRIASGLSTNEPVLIRPIVGEDAVYIIALKEVIPSQTPSFDTIREKVTEDYRLQQALDAARKAGTEFQAKLTNGLALSKSFSEICLEANVTPINLPPVSIATNSIPGLDESVNVNLLKNVALSLKPGIPGPFLQTPEGGLIVFLR